MKTKFTSTIVMLFVFNIVCIRVWGQNLPTIQELQKPVSLEIPGAKVSTSKEAHNIGIKSYFNKVGGLLATENIVPTSIITLGYDIPGFAKSGDKVWELRALSWGPDIIQQLRGILWVHSVTGSVYFSSGLWDTTKSLSPDKTANLQANILDSNYIADLNLQPRGSEPDVGESVEYTYNKRFSFEDAIEDINSIRNMLGSFRNLTEESRKYISKEKLNMIGYTSGEMQMLGFANNPNAVEGALRKQEYLIKKLRYELAKYQLKAKNIEQAQFKEIEKEYQQERTSFQEFWNSFQIAD
jgi:hypothetical protein